MIILVDKPRGICMSNNHLCALTTITKYYVCTSPTFASDSITFYTIYKRNAIAITIILGEVYI